MSDMNACKMSSVYGWVARTISIILMKCMKTNSRKNLGVLRDGVLASQKVGRVDVKDPSSLSAKTFLQPLKTDMFNYKWNGS